VAEVPAEAPAEAPGPVPVPEDAPTSAPEAAAPTEEPVVARPAGSDGVVEPAHEPAAGPGRAERVAKVAGLGALGGRATRVARQAADQVTGGAASGATGAASRVRGAGRAPGRAAAEGLARATGVPSSTVSGARTAASATAGSTTRPEAPAAAPDTPSGGGASPDAPSAVSAALPGSVRPQAPGPTRPAPAAPRQPAARRPSAPAPRRPVPADVQDEPPPRPGELICGACGAGNAPDRHFCRRCGASLADAPVQQQRSWWSRLLRPDPRPGPAAGTRPTYRRRRRFPTGLVVTIVVLGLLAAGAWYFRDTLADGYDAAVDRVAGNERVIPSAAVATSEWPGRPGAFAADGVFEQSWAPAGDGIGESVTFEFAEPFRVVYLLVRGGNGLGEELRLQEARPARVRLTYTTADGATTAEEVDLVDDGEPQRLDAGVSDVNAVTLTILDVHGRELGAPVALAEVEFFGRR